MTSRTSEIMMNEIGHDHTRLIFATFTSKEPPSAGPSRSHILHALADTKRIIHQSGVRRAL